MKVKLKAPDGYLYYDKLTDRYYSEVITTDRDEVHPRPGITERG